MTKRILGFCTGVLLATGGFLYGACGSTIAGSDCKIRCEDVDNTCVQKCTDDACRTACKTDLDNCVASCDMVVVTTPDGG
jgi:hypothetical protein